MRASGENELLTTWKDRLTTGFDFSLRLGAHVADAQMLLSHEDKGLRDEGDYVCAAHTDTGHRWVRLHALFGWEDVDDVFGRESVDWVWGSELPLLEGLSKDDPLCPRPLSTSLSSSSSSFDVRLSLLASPDVVRTMEDRSGDALADVSWADLLELIRARIVEVRERLRRAPDPLPSGACPPKRRCWTCCCTACLGLRAVAMICPARTALWFNRLDLKSIYQEDQHGGQLLVRRSGGSAGLTHPS